MTPPPKILTPQINGLEYQIKLAQAAPIPVRPQPVDVRDYAGNPVTGPKRPSANRSYERFELAGMPKDGWTREGWRRGRVRILSSLIVADYRGAAVWQWLVSISCSTKQPGVYGVRADDETCQRVLADFDLVGAEEDNHEPGVGRKFFRNVDLAPGQVSLCECKEDEETVVEPDGYTWTRKKPPTGGAQP